MADPRNTFAQNANSAGDSLEQLKTTVDNLRSGMDALSEAQRGLNEELRRARAYGGQAAAYGSPSAGMAPGTEYLSQGRGYQSQLDQIRGMQYRGPAALDVRATAAAQGAQAAGMNSASEIAARQMGFAPGTSNAFGVAATAGPIVAAAHVMAEKIKAAVDTTVESLKVLGNSALTEGQKSRGIAANIPGEWGWIGRQSSSAYDSLSGRTDRMRISAEYNATRLAGLRTEGAGMRGLAGSVFEQGAAGARGAALANMPAPFAPPSARGTIAEELAYQEAQIRLPAQDQERRAAAEAAGARGKVGVASRQETEALKQVNELEAKRAQLQREQQGLRDRDTLGSNQKENILKNLQEQERVGLQIDSQRLQVHDAIGRKSEAAVQLARAESEARKGGIAAQQSELQILQQREQRATHGAQALGRMNIVDALATAQAVNGLKERGIEGIAPWQREAIRQIAPERIAKEEERLGEKRAGQMGLRESLPETFGGGLKELREQIGQQALQIRLVQEVDEQKLAAALEPILQRKNESILKTVKAQIDDSERRIQRAFAEQRAAGN